jgi:site-specific recombinase XerD
MSRWLDDRDLDLHELSEEAVAGFVAHRRRAGYRNFITRRAMAPLVEHLRTIDAIPCAPKIIARTPVARILDQYKRYLCNERSLLPSTVHNYADIARRFIAGQFGDGSMRWKTLRSSDIHEFVLGTKDRAMSTRRLEVTGLRSWLRFLHVTGRLSQDLAACVPAVAGWRLTWLPKPLQPKQLERLLTLHDQEDPVSRRDAAIVRLLFRLGLRIGEVTDLKLDDIDWRAGEIVVRGKPRQECRLPMPSDVGRTIAEYLEHARPRIAGRQVFIRSRAPRVALTRSGVLGAVIRALRRVGAAKGGAHVLRQTAATELLRQGASLSEIAHVLRHRSIDTTAIYTKVDHIALRTLARLWPGGHS